MNRRPRRNRANEVVRGFATETHLSTENLVYPLFLKDGKGIKDEVASLPGNYRWSPDLVLSEVEACMNLGLRSFVLFPAFAEELKDKAVRAVEAGYTAMKTELGKGANSRGLDRLVAVTQAIKGRAQLLLDSLGAFKLHEAEQLGHELDQMTGIGWWEDALMPEDTTG